MAGEKTEPAAEVMRQHMEQSEESRHSRCIVCGRRNGQGLHVKFLVQPDGCVEATFPCDDVFQGFRGRLHGGVIAMLLDAAMTHCMFAHRMDGMTGELNVRYYHPVDTEEPARIRAWIDQSTHWLHLLRAELAQHDVVKAVASGKFIVNSPSTVQKKGQADRP